MDQATMMNALDRQEVGEVLCRYAHALDAEDWASMREDVFVADAVVNFPELEPLVGIDAIVGLISGMVVGLDATQHLVGTTVVAVDGDSATARGYVRAQHFAAGAPGGDEFTVVGTYEDELRRTPGGWRIARRTMVPSWADGNPGVLEFGQERARGDQLPPD